MGGLSPPRLGARGRRSGAGPDADGVVQLRANRRDRALDLRGRRGGGDAGPARSGDGVHLARAGCPDPAPDGRVPPARRRNRGAARRLVGARELILPGGSLVATPLTLALPRRASASQR